MSSEAISFLPQVLGERSDGRNDLLERDCSGQQFVTQAPGSGRTDETLIRGVTERDKEIFNGFSVHCPLSIFQYGAGCQP